MIVYRLEDANGCGPYYLTTKLADELDYAHSYLERSDHPVASRDCYWLPLKQLIRSDGYRCAFTSVEQYRKWFKGYLTKLKTAGYKLVSYRVAKRYVAFGAFQVMFIPTKAKKLKEYSPLLKGQKHATV